MSDALERRIEQLEEQLERMGDKLSKTVDRVNSLESDRARADEVRDLEGRIYDLERNT